MHDVPVWAFNPMYGSDPIYLQSYVVGEMVANRFSMKPIENSGEIGQQGRPIPENQLLLSRRRTES